MAMTEDALRALIISTSLDGRPYVMVADTPMVTSAMQSLGYSRVNIMSSGYSMGSRWERPGKRAVYIGIDNHVLERGLPDNEVVGSVTFAALHHTKHGYELY